MSALREAATRSAKPARWGEGVHPYALPLSRPLETASGLLHERRGFLLGLRDGDGRLGWGDVAPWSGLGSELSDVTREVEALDGRLADLGAGLCADTPVERVGEWAQGASRCPEVAHGIEQALLDLLGQIRGVPVARLLWPAHAARVQTHQLVAHTPDRHRIWLKIKVAAGPLGGELERLDDLRRQAHPRARLRLDVGGRWSLDQALEALPALERLGVTLLEQPLRVGDIPELATLRARAARHGIDVAVDEAVRGAADLEAHLGAAAIDAVVLKPMFLGGLLAARALAETALARGCQVIITSALESAVGRLGALHLASGLAGVHGVGTVAGLFACDLASEPPSRGDWMDLPTGAGLAARPAEPSRPSLQPQQATSGVTPSLSSADADAIPNPRASAALARPDHPALIHQDSTLTYGELADRAARRAATLLARGIGPGATVALCGPPSIDWAVCFHALGWVGAAVAPLPHRASAAELDRLLHAIAPDALVDPRELSPANRAAPERFWPLDEVRAVICTSGTSAAPHPVPLSSRQWLLSAFGSAIRLGLDIADRWLCCLPLHHVGGLSVIVRSTFYATTTLLHDRFDLAEVDDAIESGAATVVSLVPTMLEGLLEARSDGARSSPRPFPPSLRALLVGGAALSDPLVQRCRDMGAPLSLTWGMTEAASQVATRSPGDLDPSGGVGPPLPFARVDRQDGRLRIRGPLVGGEHLSSDRGHVDSSGRVHVLGRADDVIVSGGEKIVPERVEAVLAEHPGVRRALVVGVPSPRWGQRPAAVVVPGARAGAGAPSAAELRAWCRRRLAPFEVPDSFHVWSSLPEVTLGKPSRAAAQRRLMDGRGDGDFGAERSGREQATLGEPVEEPRGRPDRLEARPRDEGVHQLRARPHLAVVLSPHDVGEGDGPPADPLDGQLHQQAIVLAHRTREIGLRVDERHADVVLGEEPGDAVAELDQELLVGLVADLEDAAEEHDPGSIHLKETRCDAMNEGHDDDRR